MHLLSLLHTIQILCLSLSFLSSPGRAETVGWADSHAPMPAMNQTIEECKSLLTLPSPHPPISNTLQTAATPAPSTASPTSPGAGGSSSAPPSPTARSAASYAGRATSTACRRGTMPARTRTTASCGYVRSRPGSCRRRITAPTGCLIARG